MSIPKPPVNVITSKGAPNRGVHNPSPAPSVSGNSPAAGGNAGGSSSGGHGGGQGKGNTGGNGNGNGQGNGNQ